MKPFCVKTYQGIFSGYASTYTPDAVGDQMVPGAFQKTLWAWKKKKKRFPHVYWEHDIEEPIGVCLQLKEDEKGLFIQGKLLQDFPKTKEALQSIQWGRRGLSIGFFVQGCHFNGGTRCITEVLLKEISLVKFPCNSDAVVEEIKSISSCSYDAATQGVHRAFQRLYLKINASF
ncbi:HK97 family phage prohead protease [Holospora curviuscula]|nr:HK97 family phage prohead protease [Holospora curviuscula]